MVAGDWVAGSLLDEETAMGAGGEETGGMVPHGQHGVVAQRGGV